MPGYLLAPGALFHAERKPSTLMRINFATTQDAAFWKTYASWCAACEPAPRALEHFVGRERRQHVDQQLSAWCRRSGSDVVSLQSPAPGGARQRSAAAVLLHAVGVAQEAVLDQPCACSDSAALRITGPPRCSSAASAGPGSSSR
jgi:hypothetical protein